MLVHIYCTANDLSIEKLTVDSLVQTTTFFPVFFSLVLFLFGLRIMVFNISSPLSEALTAEVFVTMSERCFRS